MEAAISEIVAQVGKFIGQEIQRQFTYLCCFSSNIQSLRHETQQLKDARDRLQMRVDAAERNAQVALPGVERWLDSAKEKMDIINGVENEISLVQQRCLNQVKHYSISRKAKKTADCLKEFCNRCPSEPIAQDAPPAAEMVHVPNYGKMLTFESRKKIEEDIMEALRDGKVDKIGICGMGGVGKTTMAKRIIRRVKDGSLFGDVVFVAVGQQVDRHKIQREIAEWLGLELKDESFSARAHKLRTRLLDTKKSSLIIVDDIWQKLDLDDLGIPCESDVVCCKILLTSRNYDVLRKMDIQRTFGVELLSETEAWSLFREKAGDSVNNSDLHSVAKNVAKECKCLPVALVTVAGALKNEVRKSSWDDALVQLRSSHPSDLPDVIKDVYIPIKFSYDNLETEARKDLILLCSMFEEDSNINLDILTWYGMGLHLFERTEGFNGARNRTERLVEVLKSRSLLLDGVDEGHVKMHDVVRDTTRYIASDKNFMTDIDGMSMDRSTTKNRFKECTCISMTLSSRMDSQFLVGLQSSNLRLLLLMQKKEKFSSKNPVDIPGNFFEGMKEISTLSLEDIWMKSLPPTRQLQNLQTLRLSNCKILESIVVVSELLMLEIFSCRDCQKLEALPIEFTKLNRLKVLEIIQCWRLQTIAPGVISSFVRLEELILRSSFEGWEGRHNGSNTNAALEELESLSNLTCLKIEISNWHLVSEDISLPPDIKKYDIVISREIMEVIFCSKEICPQQLRMCIFEEVNIGNWVVQLLRSSRDLRLKGDGSRKVNFSELEHVKDLALRKCNSVNNLVNVNDHPSRVAFVPMLEVLYLENLQSLEEIFDTKALGGKIVNISFQNLTKISIDDCPKLRYLFPVSVARNLMQLEQLRLEHCEAMECMILGEGDEIVEGKSSDELLHLSFPKLKTLYIDHLESLTTICKGVGSIEFPKMSTITIEQVPKLRSLMKAPETPLQQLFSNQVISGKELKDLSVSHFAAASISYEWCHQTSNVAIFHNLEDLRIWDSDGIKKLMTPRIVQSLVRLRKLSVCRHSELIQVIGESNEEEDRTDEEKPQTLMRATLFPLLERLWLSRIPNLRFFCKWKYVNVEFPSLKDIMVFECKQMEALSCEACAIPNLENLKLHGNIFRRGEIPSQWTGEMKDIKR